MKKIFIGSDHAGYDLKMELLEWLKSDGFEIRDFGTFSNDPVDYPDIVHPLCKAMQTADDTCGILICGSGNGVAMTANKYPWIRAALAWKPEIASLAKEHNDANILCLPARFIDPEFAKIIISKWYFDEFKGGRHLNRINKIPI